MSLFDLIKPISSAVILLSVIIMLGWIAGVSALTTPIPNGPSMKFPTALGIFLGAILLRSFYRMAVEDRVGDSMTRIMAATILLSMVLLPLLGGYFWEIPLGLEQFFQPVSDLTKTVVPSIGAIVCIAILFSIGLFGGLGFSLPKISKWGGLLLVAITGLGLLGYLLNIPGFYYLSGKSTGMALHTALSFFILGGCFSAIGFSHKITDKSKSLGVEKHAPAQ